MQILHKYFLSFKAGVFDIEIEIDPELDGFTPYSTPMKLQQDCGQSEHNVSRTPLSSRKVVKKLNMDKT